MSLPLAFILRVEERFDHGLLVSVHLAPQGPAGVRLDGVSLQLVGQDGENIGVRVVLPIAGALISAMVTTVEMKLGGGVPATLPLGCKVVGTAWCSTGDADAPAVLIEASVPTDPFTELEVHMRARRPIVPESDGEIEWLLPEERARIAEDFPWVNEPRLPPQPNPLQIVENEPVGEDETLDHLIDELGIDDEGAEWLRDLLAEE